MKLNDLTDIFIPITINKYFSSCNTPQWISNFWINAIGMPEYLLYFTLNFFFLMIQMGYVFTTFTDQIR